MYVHLNIVTLVWGRGSVKEWGIEMDRDVMWKKEIRHRLKGYLGSVESQLQDITLSA